MDTNKLTGPASLSKPKAMNVIAQTILSQLGGNKFVVMTGCKNIYSSGDALTMHLGRNKSGAQFLKIELTSLDLYTMTFTRVKKTLNKEISKALRIKAYDEKLEVVREIEMLDNEQLQETFTEVTGLRTSLN